MPCFWELIYNSKYSHLVLVFIWNYLSLKNYTNNLHAESEKEQIWLKS